MRTPDQPCRMAYRPKEVAVRLSVCERTVRSWIAAGTLRSIRRGRVVLVRREAIEDFLREK